MTDGLMLGDLCCCSRISKEERRRRSQRGRGGSLWGA